MTSNKKTRKPRHAIKQRSAPSRSEGPRVTTARLFESIRQRRHRAALLTAASDFMVSEFTTAMGSPRPALVIRETNGVTEPADPEVVFRLSFELAAEAEQLRRELTAVLAKNTSELSVADCPLVLEMSEGPFPTEENAGHKTGEQQREAQERAPLPEQEQAAEREEEEEE
jgi:hypothetical protein